MISLVCKNKIKVFILLFFVFFSWNIFSAAPKLKISRKNKTQNVSEFKKPLTAQASSSLFYELISYKLTKASDLKNPEVYYFPDSALFFVNRHCIRNGKIIYVMDLYFPEKSGELELKGLYNTATDSADWLDDLLVSLEEERIASEILEMDNTSEEYTYELFDSGDAAEEIEEALVGGEIEQYFYNRGKALSHMSFGKEIFQIQKTESGYITIHANETDVIRFFYDSLFRLARKELWNNDATKNIENIIFEYEEDCSYPERKIIENYRNNLPQNETITYNEDGYALLSEKYVVLNENEEIKNQLLEKTSWTYDSDGRIIKSVQKIYTYKDKEYSLLKDVFEKKYTYKYHKTTDEQEEIPANQEYFEDNVLRMRLVYNSKGNFVRQYYFDEGLSVTSYYDENECIKEIYTLNNKIVRQRIYE